MLKLAARFLKRLALLAAEQLSQALALGYDKIRRCKQKLAAIFGRRMRPFFKGRLRRIDRAASIVRVSLRRRVNYLPVSRVADLISLAAYRVNRFSCYVHLRH